VISRTFHTKVGWAPADSGGLGDADPVASPVQQAAHDLRQPVAAILALASAAAAEVQAPERTRRRLEQIAGEANWIFKIIYDMLPEADAVQSPEAVDISTLVRDAVCSERLTYAGRIIAYQPEPERRYVLAVSTRLRRALANVIANAARAAGPDGCVQVTQRVRGDTELVEIMDDGPGFGLMAADHGIGLQITQQTLAECGGEMEIERLPAGQTVVRLMLPIMSIGRPAGDR
jgi:signal transduction histidine kinase